LKLSANQNDPECPLFERAESVHFRDAIVVSATTNVQNTRLCTLRRLDNQEFGHQYICSLWDLVNGTKMYDIYTYWAPSYTPFACVFSDLGNYLLYQSTDHDSGPGPGQIGIDIHDAKLGKFYKRVSLPKASTSLALTEHNGTRGRLAYVDRSTELNAALSPPFSYDWTLIDVVQPWNPRKSVRHIFYTHTGEHIFAVSSPWVDGESFEETEIRGWSIRTRQVIYALDLSSAYIPYKGLSRVALKQCPVLSGEYLSLPYEIRVDTPMLGKDKNMNLLLLLTPNLATSGSRRNGSLPLCFTEEEGKYFTALNDTGFLFMEPKWDLAVFWSAESKEVRLIGRINPPGRLLGNTPLLCALPPGGKRLFCLYARELVRYSVLGIPGQNGAG